MTEDGAQVAAGRKRDQDAHERLLDAAFLLISERRTANISVDDIARQARVGKQTIYRWWQSKHELILDALLSRTLVQTPFPATSNAADDFRTHLTEIVDMFNSPAGAVVKELVAGGQADQALADQFLKGFWDPRRALSLARMERAIADGEVRTGLDPELILDAMYGPLWLRLLLGHKPMRHSDAAMIVDSMWTGIAKDVRGETRTARRSPRSAR